jgi:hypothetical protein
MIQEFAEVIEASLSKTDVFSGVGLVHQHQSEFQSSS